ncbi:MAG: hypothetical protein AMK69_23325 [Nitrospira bacterium SG8_3]|nr:MAG: hypothetical protein AMK69_23325 [Nitrospira bacterium SG8_3]
MAVSYKRIECRRVLEKVKSFSRFKCKYNIKPYQGCTFGCIYCLQSRESLQIKINAPEVLKNELKRAKPGLVCLCGHQPIERQGRIIRQILKALASRSFPVHIIAKSDIVLDDLDVIKHVAENNFCSVSLCINTLNKSISSVFEPDAPPPKVRMNAFDKMGKAGITTGLAMVPVIPFITDSDEQLEELIGIAASRKARYAIFDVLRLEDGFRSRFIGVLKRHFPEVLVKYRRLYEFGSKPESRYTRQLKVTIRRLLAKHGLKEGVPYNVSDRKSKQVNLELY